MALQSLSGIRILITNDDGVHSLGIKVLEKIANILTPDVWVVAPEKEQSGRGCSATFDSALRIQEWSPRKFSVTGTPADNVYVALDKILLDKKPDLVLSGINHGENLANYLSLSGTIGAGFAAASQGIKAICVSQEITNGIVPKFSNVENFLPDIIKKLYSMSWLNNRVMNINFPKCLHSEVTGIRVTSQGHVGTDWKAEEGVDPSKKKYYWITSKLAYNPHEIIGTDISAIEENAISITPLYCNFTDFESMNKLKELFYGMQK